MLSWALVDDNMLTHEMKETTRVRIWMRGRDKSTVSAVKPDFDLVLTPLFEVIGLQVVDDGNVVDVLPTSRDEPVVVVYVFQSKLID